MTNDEISVREVLIKLINAAERNKFRLILGIAIGIGIGLLLNLKQKEYRLSFTIESFVNSPIIIGQIIKNFEAKIYQENFKQLAEQCDCEESVLESIQNVSFELFDRDVAVAYGLKWIEVEIEILKPEHSQDVQRCLMNFIESNTLIKESIDRYTQERELSRDSLKLEISELNHQQKAFLKILEDNKILPIGIQGGGSFGEMIMLHEEIRLLNDEIFQGKKIHAISSVSTPKKPLVSSVRNLISGLIIGVLIGIMLAIFYELRRFIS